MKKKLSAVFALVLVLMLSVPAYANDNSVTYIDIQGTESIERIVELLNSDENVILRGPRYHYKSVHGEEQNRTLTFKPKGQPSKGTYLKGYSSLGYYRTGGASVSISVSVTLPAPYNFTSVAISVDPGSMSPGTAFANVSLNNGTPGFYILMVDRVVRIKPYAVYKKPVGNGGEWQHSHSGYTMIDPLVSEKPYLVFQSATGT